MYFNLNMQTSLQHQWIQISRAHPHSSCESCRRIGIIIIYIHRSTSSPPRQYNSFYMTFLLSCNSSSFFLSVARNLVVKSDGVFLKVSSVQISVMSAMIIRFFQQFFDANSNHESSNSPPKARNEIANIWMLVDSGMISPRFKPCPRIFSHLQVLSRGIHLLEDRENWVNFTEIFATSPIEKLDRKSVV